MMIVLDARSGLLILAIVLPLVRGRVQVRSKQPENWRELCLGVELEVVGRLSVHCDKLVKIIINEHI